MQGKTFAPLTQSMPHSSEDESHGLRRESHPKRVAFLLAANIQVSIQADPSRLRTFSLSTEPFGVRRDSKASTSANQPRKSRWSTGPSGFLTSIRTFRLPRNQERCTCTCFQLPASFCQIRVSQQRAFTGSPSTGFSERCEYSTPVSLIVCSKSWDERLDQLSIFAM